MCCPKCGGARKKLKMLDMDYRSMLDELAEQPVTLDFALEERLCHGSPSEGER